MSSDWKTLYEAAQRQRLHWSTMITTLMGFVISANVIVWAYALSNYIPSLKGETPQQPIYIFVGAMATAISLGLWRIYTHYLDNCITSLYPEIIYYETKLGAAENSGLWGYLLNELRIEKTTNEKIPAEQRSNFIGILLERKAIGDRRHNYFDIVAIMITAILIIVCLIAEAVTGKFFSGTYWWVHVICMTPVLAGLGLTIYALHLSPRNPSKEDIEKIINEANPLTSISMMVQSNNMEQKSGDLTDIVSIKLQLDRIESICNSLKESSGDEQRNSRFSFLVSIGITFIVATIGIVFSVPNVNQINKPGGILLFLLFGGLLVLFWAALGYRRNYRKSTAISGTVLTSLGVITLALSILFDLLSTPILIGLGWLAILIGVILMDVTIWFTRSRQ